MNSIQTLEKEIGLLEKDIKKLEIDMKIEIEGLKDDLIKLGEDYQKQINSNTNKFFQICKFLVFFLK